MDILLFLIEVLVETCYPNPCLSFPDNPPTQEERSVIPPQEQPNTIPEQVPDVQEPSVRGLEHQPLGQ